jgi:hypothetical protein
MNLIDFVIINLLLLLIKNDISLHTYNYNYQKMYQEQLRSWDSYNYHIFNFIQLGKSENNQVSTM